MDNFAEQLVKKEMSGSDRVKKGLILAGGISVVLILTAGSLLMLGECRNGIMSTVKNFFEV